MAGPQRPPQEHIDVQEWGGQEETVTGGGGGQGRLRRAGIIPKKHILDNEVSEALKTIIQDEYKMQIKLVPPGTHRRNAAEVAIRNFKAQFLSVLAWGGKGVSSGRVSGEGRDTDGNTGSLLEEARAGRSHHLGGRKPLPPQMHKL